MITAVAVIVGFLYELHDNKDNTNYDNRHNHQTGYKPNNLGYPFSRS